MPHKLISRKKIGIKGENSQNVILRYKLTFCEKLCCISNLVNKVNEKAKSEAGIIS
jgi:hypothetical protein